MARLMWGKRPLRASLALPRVLRPEYFQLRKPSGMDLDRGKGPGGNGGAGRVQLLVDVSGYIIGCIVPVDARSLAHRRVDKKKRATTCRPSFGRKLLRVLVSEMLPAAVK